MLREVSFHCEEEASSLAPSPRAAMISITNPGDAANLREGWGALLRVAFADAVYDVSEIEAYGRMWHLSSFGFPAKEHAVSILAFLDGLPPEITTLRVHCGAGISRSGAVAKFVAERYGLEFPHDYARHNETLYRLLQQPTRFDAVLARYPRSKPGFWASIRKRLAG